MASQHPVPMIIDGLTIYNQPNLQPMMTSPPVAHYMQHLFNPPPPPPPEQKLAGFPLEFWFGSHLAEGEKPLFGKPEHLKQTLEAPFPMSVMRSNVETEILARAEKLRKDYPEQIFEVTKPQKWMELHKYFDAYDIFVEGVQFLYSVLEEIAKRNEFILADMERHIDQYAAEWVAAYHHKVANTPLSQSLLDHFGVLELDGLEPHFVAPLARLLNKHHIAVHTKVQSEKAQRIQHRQIGPANTGRQPCHMTNPPQMDMVLAENARTPAMRRDVAFGREQHVDKHRPSLPPQDGRFYMPPAHISTSRNVAEAGIVDEDFHGLRVPPSAPVSWSSSPPRDRQGSMGPLNTSPNSSASRSVNGHKRYMSFDWGPYRPFMNDDRVIHGSNGSVTIFYGDGERMLHQEDNGRTVYVGNINLEIFNSEMLQKVMGAKVMSITFLPKGRIGSPDCEGQAFVYFADKAAAAYAIRHYNGHKMGNPQGKGITVGVPNNNRQSRPNYHLEYHPSVHNSANFPPNARPVPLPNNPQVQPQQYTRHQYSTNTSRASSPVREPLTIGLQNQLAAGVVVKGPYEVNCKSRPADHQSNPPRQDYSSVKKENVPTNFSTQKDKPRKKIGKGYKDKTLTKLTPVVSPQRSNQAPQTRDTLDQVSRRVGQIGNSQDKHNECGTKPFFKPFDRRNHQGSSSKSSVGHNSMRQHKYSQTEDMSREKQTIQAVGFMTSTSRPTTTANATQMHVASSVVPNSKTSQLQKKVENVLASGDVRATNSANSMTYKMKNNNHRHGNGNHDFRNENYRGNQSTNTAQPPPKFDVNLSYDNSARTDLPSLGAGSHDKKKIGGSSHSASSQRKADSKPQNSQKTNVQHNAAMPEDGREAVDGPTRNPASTPVLDKIESPSIDSNVDLQDANQFPSLDPPKQCPSLIADGKRPAAPQSTVVTGSSQHRGLPFGERKNQMKHLVAVPRVIQPGPKPGNQCNYLRIEIPVNNRWDQKDGESFHVGARGGNRVWPFVKRFWWQ